MSAKYLSQFPYFVSLFPALKSDSFMTFSLKSYIAPTSSWYYYSVLGIKCNIHFKSYRGWNWHSSRDVVSATWYKSLGFCSASTRGSKNVGLQSHPHASINQSINQSLFKEINQKKSFDEWIKKRWIWWINQLSEKSWKHLHENNRACICVSPNARDCVCKGAWYTK